MKTALSLPISALRPCGSDWLISGSTLRTRVGDVERIGDRLLDDADGDRRLAVVAAVAPLVGGAELDARHLAELHLMVAGELDDDVAELLGRDEAGARQHVNSRSLLSMRPDGQLDVLGAQRVLDVLDRQVEGGEPLAVDPDAHGIAPLAEDRDVGDAGAGSCSRSMTKRST